LSSIYYGFTYTDDPRPENSYHPGLTNSLLATPQSTTSARSAPPQSAAPAYGVPPQSAAPAYGAPPQSAAPTYGAPPQPSTSAYAAPQQSAVLQTQPGVATSIVSCKTLTCDAGTHCEYVQVQCLRAPCFPVPQCVPGVENPQKQWHDVHQNETSYNYRWEGAPQAVNSSIAQ